MKLILDANLLVSAYIADGKIHADWQNGLGAHQIFISPEIFTEVERALQEKASHLTRDQIRTALTEILERCKVVRLKTNYQGALVDEHNRHLADLALAVGADKILTGDHPLPEMKVIGGAPVVALAQFLKNENL